MESTAKKRVWHKGPPPHVGWWNTSRQKQALDIWRWWDGKHWSAFARPTFRADFIQRRVTEREVSLKIYWSDYWPADARVPRIDPAVGFLDIGDDRWRLFEGVPLKGRKPFVIDTSAWMRWAEQRRAQAAEQRDREAKILGVKHDLMVADEAPPLNPNQGMDHVFIPVEKLFINRPPIIGRTRMVDGNELTLLADDVESLAIRLRKLSNEAS